MHILASGLSLSFSGSLLVAALLQLGSECFAGAAAASAAAAALSQRNGARSDSHRA